MANKRKKATAIAAGVLSAALLLGGTFAWTSLDQTAKNETTGVVNVGGRLHDDFNGKNKDVYVENFTDSNDGGQPIYARVRLDEYMEVGPEAGDLGNSDRKATPIAEGMRAESKSTWRTHIPSQSDVTLCNTECNTGKECTLHTHWKWEMGGETVYMPTFNKDKDSTAADINGTYDGTDEEDKIYYDDYVVYTTDDGGIVVDVVENTATQNGEPLADAEGNQISFEDKEVLTAVEGPVYSVTDYAFYDNDTDSEEDEHYVGNDYLRAELETHPAKKTLSPDAAAAEANGVITMEEWKNEYNSQPGNYWVYDDDGWAYWANPIMPGQATSLLLSGIDMEKNPGEKCFYAINVVAEFATAEDWSYFSDFDAEGENQDAATLLKAASENVYEVKLQSASGTIYPGGTMQFSTSLQKVVPAANAAMLAEEDAPKFNWFLQNDDGSAYVGESSIDANGLLKVSANEAADTVLYVCAESLEVPGVTGKSGIVVITKYSVDILPQEDGLVLQPGSSAQLEGTVKDTESGSEVTDAGTISWSATDEEGEPIDGVSIDDNGKLTVGDNVPEGTVIKVTAGVNGDGEGEDSGFAGQGETIYVVGYPMDMNDAAKSFAAAELGEIVEDVDGSDWIVLARDGSKVLIWAKDVVGEPIQRTTAGIYWENSNSRAWLNGEYYENQVPTLKPYIAPTQLYCNMRDQDPVTDYVFSLTRSDLTGDYVNSPGARWVYTYGDAVLEAAESHLAASESYWLRSYSDYSLYRNACFVTADGSPSEEYSATSEENYEAHHVRPAMWLDLSRIVLRNPEIATSDNLSWSQYAVLTDDGSGEGTYAMYLLRSNSNIIPGESTYGGKTILAYDQWSNGRFEEIPDKDREKVSSVETVNTIQARTLLNTFENFSALKSVNLSKLDESILDSFRQVFMSCTALETLDLSYLDFSGKNAVEATHLVSSCSNLTSVKLPKNLKASEMAFLFDSCSALTEIENLETWDVSECTNFNWAFGSCSALTSLPAAVEGWDTSSATKMNYLFANCTNLVLDCRKWNVDNVETHTDFARNASGITAPTWVN